MNKVHIALALWCMVSGLAACRNSVGSGSEAGGTGGAGKITEADGGLVGSATGGSTGNGAATNAGGASGAGGVSRTDGSGASGGTSGSGGALASGSTSNPGGTMGGNTGGAGSTTTTGGSINTGGALGTQGTPPSCNRDGGVTNVKACGYLATPPYDILDTNVTAEVTVEAVSDLVETSPCGSLGQTRRVSLAAADGSTWNLDLNVTGLPANFIRKGDALGLTVASWRSGSSLGQPPVSQSVVVTRDGKTILITWTETASSVKYPRDPKSGGAPAPVTVAGLSLTDDGIICEYPASLCPAWHHRALITVGSSSATVEPKQSVNVGGLQVVLEYYADAVDYGFCDGFGHLTFAAFVP